jgi:hypothetical protein
MNWLQAQRIMLRKAGWPCSPDTDPRIAAANAQRPLGNLILVRFRRAGDFIIQQEPVV